jgi:hypothetical protein
MPTPFTHLEIAQRLLRDEAIPARDRALLNAHRSAFLLGSIAADARVGSGASRDTTHFYMYGQDIVEHPWRVMAYRHPAIMHPHSTAHQVFLAGYVAHLAVDEVWSKYMVGPNFGGATWGPNRAFRFYMLHIILIYMDERDRPQIEDWQPDTLCAARPNDWLPFISDEDLLAWLNIIHRQITPGGESETLEIFGRRISRSPEQMRAVLDSEAAMQANLWDNVPRAALQSVEARMYDHARQQLIVYLDESVVMEVK